MSAHAMQHPHDMEMVDKQPSMTMAFIIGAAIGAVSGLLFAPRSGREMRDTLRTKGSDANQKAHDTIERVRGMAHDKTDQIQDKADMAMDKADDMQDRTETTLEDVAQDARRSTRGRHL